MWIWECPRARAAIRRRSPPGRTPYGVSTVFIKSADGAGTYNNQFTPELVAALHANGLRACAWQYVYGVDPLGEAAQATAAIRPARTAS